MNSELKKRIIQLVSHVRKNLSEVEGAVNREDVDLAWQMFDETEADFASLTEAIDEMETK